MTVSIVSTEIREKILKLYAGYLIHDGKGKVIEYYGRPLAYSPTDFKTMRAILQTGVEGIDSFLQSRFRDNYKMQDSNILENSDTNDHKLKVIKMNFIPGMEYIVHLNHKGDLLSEPKQIRAIGHDGAGLVI